MSLMGTALVLAWVAIILLALSVAGLLRQVHLLLLRENAGGDPPPSAPARVPQALAAADGVRVVVFASPSCLTCVEVLDELARLGQEASIRNQAPDRLEQQASKQQASKPSHLAFTVVTAGDRHPRWPPQLEYIEHAADLSAQFGVVATPHALTVVGDQVVASTPVGSVAALRRLLADLPAAPAQLAEQGRS